MTPELLRLWECERFFPQQLTYVVGEERCVRHRVKMQGIRVYTSMESLAKRVEFAGETY